MKLKYYDNKKCFHSPVMPKYTNLSHRIEEANESIDKSTVNMLKFIGVKDEDIKYKLDKLVKVGSGNKGNCTNLNSSSMINSSLSFMKVKPKIKKNKSSENVDAIFKLNDFEVKFKKRSKSIEYSKNRIKLKYHLELVSKQEMNIFIITSGSFYINKHLRLSKIKKIKPKAKSLKRENKNNLTEFYYKQCLSEEKKRQSILNAALEKEKRRKLEVIKKLKQKDKYNNSILIDDKNKIQPVFTKIPVMPVIKSINLSQNKSKNKNHNRKRSVDEEVNDSSKSVFITHTKRGRYGRICMTKSNSTNFFNKNNDLSEILYKNPINNQDTTRTQTKLFSTSSDIHYLRSFTSNFNIKNTSNYFANEKTINLNNNNLDSDREYNKSSNNIVKINISSSKLNNTLYTNYKKLAYTNNILQACNKATNYSFEVQKEFGNISHSTNAKDLKNKLNSDTLMEEMNKDMREESRQFKSVKRFFIYPKRAKGGREYICDDKENMINICKQVDKIKDGTAFIARDIINEKFQIKLAKGEIINYKPSYKTNISTSEFIKEFNKNKAQLNSKLSRRVLAEMSIKKATLQRKVDDFLDNIRYYK